MIKQNLNELNYFVIVARTGSFTRAAAQLGVTQSALSQAIRSLEANLDIRLLTRTTRSVSPTLAGERLLNAIGHRFDDIENELEALTELRDKPAGTVKITCGDFIIQNTLLPKLANVLKQYPDINIEFNVNYGYTDIVAQRIDAGVRLGETIDKDMIAVPIGKELNMAAVASPEYFTKHPKPNTPKDLTAHNCINIRFPTHGGLYAWEFEKEGEELSVNVRGQLIFNTSHHIVEAALQGLGIAFLPEEEFGEHIKNGNLIKVLADWCPAFPGYYLYYPSRRQPSPAFKIVLEALKQQ